MVLKSLNNVPTTAILNLVVLAGGGYMLYQAIKGLNLVSAGTGEVVGNGLAKFQQFINGNHAIEATTPGVALTSLSLVESLPGVFTMSDSKRQAIAAMHPDNPTILAAILTPANRVKAQYLSFIDTRPVTLGDV